MDGTSQIVGKSKAAEENWLAHQRAMDAGHAEYVEIAKKCDRFYRGGGEQWDEEARRALESEGRPALEINMVLSTVNALKGEQAEQRADIVYKPRRNGTHETAATLTKLVQQILYANDYPWAESQVFDDGIIQDRGYFDVRIDFTDEVQGEVRITSEDPLCVELPPDAKEYDPRTWPEVTVTRWLLLDEIEVQYGKEARDKVEAFIGTTAYGFGQDSIRFTEQTFGDAATVSVSPDTALDRKISRVRVIERQHRKLSKVRYFVDNQTGDKRMIPAGWSPEKVQRVASMADVSVIEGMQRRIRWTVSVDGVDIFDDWSPYKTFTIIPFFPYFRRGRPMGVVRNLLSPQEQLNKLESQELHIINTTANSGWAVEAGSLINMTEEELEERGAETGLVLVYKKDSQAPAKIQANQIPTGIDRISQKAANSIRVISGVNEAMLGHESAEVSGVAITRKQAGGLVQAKPIFDNLARSRHLLANKVLELIQQFYTETRVLQVTDYYDPEQRSEELVINAMNEAGEVVNDLTLGEYSVVVSSAPSRSSYMETQFAQALQLREVGVQIPDDVIIESSNLENKREIAKRVRDMQGMGEPTQQELQIMQLQQQLAMKQAMLSVAEMEATVQKLQAEAMLQQAKAGQVAQETEAAPQKFGAEMQMQLQKLREDFAKHLTDLQSKQQLAQMHIDANREQTLYTTTAKRAVEERRMGSQLLQTQIQSAAKAKTPAAKPRAKR